MLNSLYLFFNLVCYFIRVNAYYSIIQINKYNQIIEYKNIDLAILKMVDKNSCYYLDKFTAFYPIVKENFSKNREEILKFIERKMEEKPNVEKINTAMYGMSVTVNYKKLHEDFLETCKNAKNN